MIMSTATAEKTTKATEKTANQSNVIALVKKDTVDIVAAKVREFQERGELHFPTNYSLGHTSVGLFILYKILI